MRYVLASVGAKEDGPSDADLLNRYVSQGDQLAFELLVWRYSGMVNRTCFAKLHDNHLAEDATQAVFLALARGAKSIGNKFALAGWLNRVALRVSMRAAVCAAKKKSRIDSAPLKTIETQDEDYADADTAKQVREEVARLPEKYQSIIYLNFFEGLSHADIAKRLGCPTGTVNSLIARGKDVLRRRLVQRGISLPVLGIVATTAGSSSARPSAAFVEATIRAAKAFAERSTVSQSSAFSAELAHGVIRDLMIEKGKIWVGIGVLGLMLAGVSWMGFSGSAANSTPEGIAPIPEGPPLPAMPVKSPVRPSKAIDTDTIDLLKKTGAAYGRFVRIKDMRGYENTVFTPGESEDGVPGFLWREAPGREFPKLPRITVPFAVEATSCELSSAAVKELLKQKNLTSFTATTRMIDDEDVKSLAELRNLRHLDLAGCEQITNNGLKELAAATGLEELDLRATAIDFDCLEKLTALKRLKFLDLSGTRVGDHWLKEMSAFPALATLKLNQTRVTNAGLKFLKDCPKLEHLSFKDTTTSDEGMKELSEIVGLTSLQLNRTGVSDQGIKHLTACKALNSLILDECRFTERSCSTLAKIGTLRCLSLQDCPQLTDDGLKELASLKDLEALYMKRAFIGDEGIKHLAGMKSLRRIDLSSTKVTDACCKTLLGLKKLEWVLLDWTSVGDKTLEELKTLQNLDHLFIAGAAITVDGVKHLTEMKQLRTLCLNNIQINDAGLKELSRCSQLEELYMSGCSKVTDRGIKELGGVKTLRALYVPYTGISEAGCKELKTLLPECVIRR